MYILGYPHFWKPHLIHNLCLTFADTVPVCRDVDVTCHNFANMTGFHRGQGKSHNCNNLYNYGCGTYRKHWTLTEV